MRRWLRPTYIVDRIHEIEIRSLWARGIRGVILDLDNTLVPWNQAELPPEIQRWIEMAKIQGLRLCLVSNAFRGARVKQVAERLGLNFVLRAGKPFPWAFRRGLAMLGTAPQQTCAIGDQIFTDMLGANWLGLDTILVTPMTTRESPHTRLIRFLERPLRRRWRKLLASKPPPGAAPPA